MSRSEQKRAAILAAAAREFQRHGFEAANMDRISQAAQVSKRTVYNHFASKELLFQTIMKEMFDRGLHATDRAYEPGVALETQLRDIARQEVALLADDEFIRFARVSLSEFLGSPEFLAEALAELLEAESGVARWIRQAAEDGRLRVEDVEMAAEQFISLIKAFAFWPQVLGLETPPDKAKTEKVVDDTVKMFLGHYAA